MSGPSFDLAAWLFNLLAAALVGFGWYRFWQFPKNGSGRNVRRGLLFLGYLAVFVSFLMYLVEFFVEFRYSHRALYDNLSGAAMILLIAAVIMAIAGKGAGRILLVLAALLIFGLWFSITPLRLF